MLIQADWAVPVTMAKTSRKLYSEEPAFCGWRYRARPGWDGQRRRSEVVVSQRALPMGVPSPASVLSRGVMQLDLH